MSITFRFSGGSDDIVTVTTETTSGGTTEEYYTYESGPIMWRARICDTASGDSVVITALVLDSETWHFAAGHYFETLPLPDWPVSIRQSEDCRYSAEMVVVAPDSAELTDIWPVDKDAENDE